MTTAPDTIVLVHGFWVTPRSWEEWITHYNTRKKPIPAQRYIEVDGQKQVEEIEVEFSWLKMSKSKKTAVTPDEMAEKYGADVYAP